ncbi:MAG: outer membrane protein assembly factor BamA, partial [Oceanococcus sp.]
LYDTGLFRNVVFLREAGTLIVRVEERPAIVSFSVEGNDKIGGDELDKALADAGLSEGELFRQALLDQVKQEMQRQYYSNGFYGVKIDAEVTELDNNRVSIAIQVEEGKPARIQSINVVGNEAFSDETLLNAFELAPSQAWRLFQSDDKYSKQKLLGDLEGLSSFYLDRGYLKFDVPSVQVSLSPEKRDIYVTINVSEGQPYTVKDVKFSGELILNEDYLRQLVLIKPGQTFSRRQATQSAEYMEGALANVGYAFAKVQPMPEIAEDDQGVTLNFAVQAAKRTYVRQITFAGNLKTNDETLRREMRQLEGAVFSRSQVERSRTRIARLPFIQEANVDTVPVPGSEDLVDISFNVEERPPGSIQFGVGFSGSEGFLINGSLTHTNFLGTGNRVALELENNQISDTVSVSWTDPYATPDGISRTVAAFFRKSEGVIRFSSGFDSNSYGTSLTYGIPISEYSSFRLGLGLEETSINTFATATADEVLRFVAENGSNFTTWEFRTGFARDTRNRTIFASRGSLSRINLDLVMPGSDIEFYKASYQLQHYQPIFRGVFAEVNANVGLVEGYGDTDIVPPYENFFAGGTGSVRGFRSGSLGPRDTPFNNAFGGKLRSTLQTNIIIPTPLESDNKTTRLSLFYDLGNVFAEPGDWEYDELRSSAGLAFEWFTPFLGLLELSYAYPLDLQEGDREDRFQINFGGGF